MSKSSISRGWSPKPRPTLKKGDRVLALPAATYLHRQRTGQVAWHMGITPYAEYRGRRRVRGTERWAECVIVQWDDGGAENWQNAADLQKIVGKKGKRR